MEYAPGDPSNNWKWMESIYKDAIHLEADSEDEANEKIEVCQYQLGERIHV